MSRRITIRDIALQLKLSTATVSKVLNNAPDSRISSETANRVRELAERLQFTPSAMARELRLRRSRTIGVIVPNLNLFTVGIVEAIEHEAIRHDYAIILASSGESSDRERQHLALASTAKVDALVVIPARQNRNQALYGALLKQNIPVVFVDRYVRGVSADYIGVENEQGAYRATQYLIARGAKRVGLVGGATVTPLEERIAGYRRALAEAYLPAIDLSGCLEPGDFHRALTTEARVDGIFWSSYIQLQRRYVSILSQGLDLECTANLPFAGFDQLFISVANLEEYQVARLLVRPLPTVVQPFSDLGQRAVQQVLSRLGGDQSEAIHLRLPVSYFGFVPDTSD